MLGFQSNYLESNNGHYDLQLLFRATIFSILNYAIALKDQIGGVTLLKIPICHPILLLYGYTNLQQLCHMASINSNSKTIIGRGTVKGQCGEIERWRIKFGNERWKTETLTTL